MEYSWEVRNIFQLSYTWNKALKRELAPLENTRKCSGLNHGAPRKVDSAYSDAQELNGQKVGAVLHQRQSTDGSGMSSVILITDMKNKMGELRRKPGDCFRNGVAGECICQSLRQCLACRFDGHGMSSFVSCRSPSTWNLENVWE